MASTTTSLQQPRDGSTGDVIPTCPLCHTSTALMSTSALLDGAYWRCERCGQVWDAVRLQTAANYSRHAASQLASSADGPLAQPRLT